MRKDAFTDSMTNDYGKVYTIRVENMACKRETCHVSHETIECEMERVAGEKLGL